MNLLKKVVFGTAVFALSINALFLIVPLILQPYAPELPNISISQYIVVLIFSFVISLANRIFDTGKLHVALKIAIHYVAVTASCVVLFASWRPDSFPKFASHFVAIILFTAIYAIVFACIVIGKKIYAKSKLSQTKQVETNKSSKKDQTDYEPRFK